MKNSIFYKLSSKVLLNIKGNNIDNFIKRLNNNKIELLDIKNINYKETNILIKKEDLDKVLKIKSIYKIKVLDYKGVEKTKINILNNKYIILFILLFLIILYILSNIVFRVDIITTDSKMKETLLEELGTYGLKKYTFKKNYITIQKIKKKILSKHKNDIEWIEIENIGTRYIIKYEPRVKNKEKKEIKNQNIVSKYDALIKDMNIEKGEIIKDVGTYVKKGDIIVSGEIKLNEELKEKIGAKGNVYGEVWYNVKVTYPYKYYRSIKTGNKKNIFAIKFLNKKIEIFNFNKFKTKEIKENKLVCNKIFPICISKEYQKETNVVNKKYNDKNIISPALSYSKEKIEGLLDDDEYILKYKILNKSKNDNSVTLNIFFSVLRNITLYKTIENKIIE